MAKKAIEVTALKHREATRRNIPTAEFESVMRKEDKSPVQIAYERRNRDLDPQLVWRGKDDQDWSDLDVAAPPLYIQEKVHPKVIIEDLKRETKERAKDWGIPDPAAVDGSEAERMLAFRDAFRMLDRRIRLFQALPFASLDRMALKREADAIGRIRPDNEEDRVS